jgi:hypothetical protein
VRASRSRPAISNHTTGAAIGTSYVDGLTCPGWARTATASCQGLPSDVRHPRPHPGGSQSDHRTPAAWEGPGDAADGWPPRWTQDYGRASSGAERSPLSLRPEVRTGLEVLGTRSVSDSRASDAEERQRQRRRGVAQGDGARPDRVAGGPGRLGVGRSLTYLRGEARRLCVRRHRSASCDARPPRLRKSRSASVGARAAARW